MYTVTVDGGNGCSNEDSIKVTVNPQASVQARSDTVICNQSSILLSTHSTQATTFDWTPATGLSDTTIANPTASPSATTLYTVTASNKYNCSTQSSVLISVLPVPIVTKTNDTTICQDKTVKLLAGGGVSYTWSSSNNQVNATGTILFVSPSDTAS